MYSVPVRRDASEGYGELKGLLRFDGGQLALQYQIADQVFHEFRTAPDELALPPEAIAEARLEGGFLGFRPVLELRFSDLAALGTLPLPEAGRLQLRVRRSDRRDARKIVDGVNAVCAELRLARLDASLDALAARDPRRGG